MTKNDVSSEESDKTIINQKERDSCPKCGSIRVIKKLGYYLCCRCKWTGDNPNKVMWYFGIPCRDGPSVGRIINPSVRDRNSCPSCDSMRISKRVHTQDYRCDNCGNICKSPKKIKWGVSTII